MLKITKNIYPLSVLLILLLLLVQSASAGAPEGDPESLDSELRFILQNRLNREGYDGRYPNGQDLSRGISAYLWDNRRQLTDVAFSISDARQVDVLVCVMSMKQYPEFAKYASGIKEWCGQITKAR